MRKIIFGLATTLLFVGACKKSESEKAAKDLAKAQEQVESQQKDIRDEQKDVIKEQKDVASEQKDVAKERAELAVAEAKLAGERSNFELVTKEKLSRIDAKIATLEARGDAKAKERASDLRIKRNEVADKMNRIGERTADTWSEFVKDIGDGLDKVEKDIDNALD